MSNRYLINKRGAFPGKSGVRFLVTLFFAALIAGGLGLAGCRKQTSDLSQYHSSGNTKADTLRIFNMLPDSGQSYPVKGYVLYVNDSMKYFVGRSLWQRTICYGLPPSLAIPSQGGTINLKVTSYTFNVDTPPLRHPDPSRIVCQTTIEVPAHSGFSDVFVYDSVGKPVIKFMPVTMADPGAPAPGTFKVRVINFGYDLQDASGQTYMTSALNSAGQQYNLQLQTQDSAIVQGNENIPFSTAGPYREYDYGTWQFLVYNLTTQAYLNNSGPLNDIGGTFDLSTALYPGYVTDPAQGVGYNYLFPNYLINTAGLGVNPTLRIGNISSYGFSAGCCYTILTIGNMYTVTLDRQYGVGDLDNYARVQLVNAAPGQTDLQVTITAGGKTTTVNSLPFGGSTEPMTVPAGEITCTFSSHGQTLYSYSSQVPRLANYLLCYTSDLKKVPFVFPQVISLTSDDYVPPADYGQVPGLYQLNKVSCLNLCPDGGSINFTNNVPVSDYAETPTKGDELPYKAGKPIDVQSGLQPASRFGIRLSGKRTDSLANQLVAVLNDPFPRIPAPGTYTLIAAGLLETPDTTQSLRIILVKHTNFIPKAQ